jgi:hypothetical protein
LDWEPGNVSPGQSQSDLILCAVYNVTQAKWIASIDSFPRSAGTGVYTFGAGAFALGNTIDVFVFAYNPTTRKSSDNIYDQVTAS